MSFESVLVSGLSVLLAVAASSFFVKIASAHDREIHLREDAAHHAARRRRHIAMSGYPLEAAPLLPAGPFTPPTTRSPRLGGARLQLRYAALVLLVAAWPTSSGQVPQGPAAGAAAPVASHGVETVRPKVDCRRVILAGGFPRGTLQRVERCDRAI